MNQSHITEEQLDSADINEKTIIENEIQDSISKFESNYKPSTSTLQNSDELVATQYNLENPINFPTHNNDIEQLKNDKNNEDENVENNLKPTNIEISIEETQFQTENESPIKNIQDISNVSFQYNLDETISTIRNEDSINTILSSPVSRRISEPIPLITSSIAPVASLSSDSLLSKSFSNSSKLQKDSSSNSIIRLNSNNQLNKSYQNTISSPSSMVKNPSLKTYYDLTSTNTILNESKKSHSDSNFNILNFLTSRKQSSTSNLLKDFEKLTNLSDSISFNQSSSPTELYSPRRLNNFEESKSMLNTLLKQLDNTNSPDKLIIQLKHLYTQILKSRSQKILIENSIVDIIILKLKVISGNDQSTLNYSTDLELQHSKTIEGNSYNSSIQSCIWCLKILTLFVQMSPQEYFSKVASLSVEEVIIHLFKHFESNEEAFELILELLNFTYWLITNNTESLEIFEYFKIEKHINYLQNKYHNEPLLWRYIGFVKNALRRKKDLQYLDDLFVSDGILLNRALTYKSSSPNNFKQNNLLETSQLTSISETDEPNDQIIIQ